MTMIMLFVTVGGLALLGLLVWGLWRIFSQNR